MTTERTAEDDEAIMFKEQRDNWREIAVEKDKALNEARAEIERWKEKSHAAVDAADRKIKRLETRLAAMQAALEPFAQFADHVAAEHPGWDHDAFEITDNLTMAPFRRARAALSQKDGGKE